MGGGGPGPVGSGGGTAPSRPHLRHTASSVADFAPTSLMGGRPSQDAINVVNRMRAGSDLSGTGATDAFGNGGGGGGSATVTGSTTTPWSRPALQSHLSYVSAAATEASAGSGGSTSTGSGSGSGGSYGRSTLDYLGLGGSGGGGGGGSGGAAGLVDGLDLETPRAADFNFHQNDLSDFSRAAAAAAAAAAASSSGASRHRASTVSNFARPASSSSYSDLISAANLGLGSKPLTTPPPSHQQPIGLFEDIGGLAGGTGPTEYLFESGGGGGSGGAFRDSLASARPRATTISMLEPKAHREAAARSAAVAQAATTTTTMAAPPRRDESEFASMHRPIAPRHVASASVASLASTLDGVGGGRSEPHGQTPTRSLWLGNLDVMTTAQQLNDVFCKYGVIESLRLLPEKSCAFVNFIERADAIRAKDDILIRLGGHIPELSDTPVRVGFGKIDSVPTAAPSTSTLKYSMSNSSLSSLGDKDEGRDLREPPVATNGARGHHANAPSTSFDPNAQPSRALWIGSIPGHTTPGTLLSIFGPFGAVESARVLTNKQCGFINFESIDSAIAARTALNGREILGAEVGAVKIGFARIPVKGPAGEDAMNDAAGEDMLAALKDVKGTSAVSHENVANIENYGSNLVIDLINKGVLDDVKKVRAPSSVTGRRANADDARSDAGSSVASHRYTASEDGGVSEQQMIMMVLSQGEDSLAEDVLATGRAEKPALYYSYIPVLPERSQYRRFDSAGLKDIRKRLDGPYCDQAEIDQITTDLMEDCVMLSSDYIGNTIIQKLYDRASPHLRLAMLDRISPHLALIGTHKNGTWAAQKIIECSNTPEELSMISRNLAPYVPPLSADSYGNYLVSACLRFGPPYNSFVFDAMVDRVWDIAQTRFGARCMRTCLESEHTPSLHRKRIATAIILHSIPLATNPNGALLLTWLMDSSELPGRYGLLASRLASYVQHLCTHKLASLTVLRIVNQRDEPEASSVVLEAIFGSPQDAVLRDVLADQVHGVHTIQKIVCGGFVEPADRSMVLSATKRVLEGMRVTSAYAYKRLLEECGLPVPVGPPAGPAPSLHNNGGVGGGMNNGGRSRPNVMRTSGGFSTNPSFGPGATYQPARHGMPAGGGYNMPPYNPQQLIGAGGVDSLMSSMQAFQLGQGLAAASAGAGGAGGMPPHGGLSPLVVPGQGGAGFQPMSPGLPPMSPTPTIGSFATPHAQLMSPNSDPFNPVSSVGGHGRDSCTDSLPPLLVCIWHATAVDGTIAIWLWRSASAWWCRAAAPRQRRRTAATLLWHVESTTTTTHGGSRTRPAPCRTRRIRSLADIWRVGHAACDDGEHRGAAGWRRRCRRWQVMRWGLSPPPSRAHG